MNMTGATNMTRWQGIFVDFYGTLAAGDRAAVQDVCQHVIDQHGLDVRAADLAKAWGRRFLKKIEQANGPGFVNLVECERQTLCELMQNYLKNFDATSAMERMRAYLQAPPLYQEVRDVLAALRLPVVVVSNVDREDLECAIAHHGLTFAGTVTSEDARSYKPHTGLFACALSRLGWSADRVLHVGDSLHSDVAGARRAGLTAVWIRRSDRISDMGHDQADYTFKDLRPLVDLVGDGPG